MADRNCLHSMLQWLWIVSMQQGAAVVADIWMLMFHSPDGLDQQQLRPMARMSLLATRPVATALAPLGRLKPWPTAGGQGGFSWLCWLPLSLPGRRPA